jgi:hypothetical protein
MNRAKKNLDINNRTTGLHFVKDLQKHTSEPQEMPTISLSSSLPEPFSVHGSNGCEKFLMIIL